MRCGAGLAPICLSGLGLEYLAVRGHNTISSAQNIWEHCWWHVMALAQNTAPYPFLFITLTLSSEVTAPLTTVCHGDSLPLPPRVRHESPDLNCVTDQQPPGTKAFITILHNHVLTHFLRVCHVRPDHATATLPWPCNFCPRGLNSDFSCLDILS